MTLLRLLSWPYLRKHVLRTVLTTAGIALGVAVFVAMHTANRSVINAFTQTVDRIAGKTQLQVTAGETGFGEDILERVQAATAVAVAVPVIESVVDSQIPGQGNLLVLGTDMTGDGSLRDYDLESDETVIDDPLIFLAQPDSIILSQTFADRNHLTIGAKLPLGTIGGEKVFTVRGITRAQGLATAFGGNLAVMDIYAVQKMFGRGRTFDRIDIGLQPGVAIAEATREIEGILGAGFDVQPPATRGAQFESVLAGYTTMVSVSSAFALFIGMFIIYSSFATAVAQRRTEIGIVRALGASRAQVGALFLGESAVMGTIGSVIGVGIGLLLARAITASVSAVIADIYFVPQGATVVSTSNTVVLISLALGIVTSVVAAVVPARSAAKVDPVEALQKGHFQNISTREGRVRTVIAGAFAVAAIVLLVFGRTRPLFYASYLSAMLVPLLLGPLLTRAIARLFRPALKRLRPVEGALAADSIIQAPRRTAASVVALTLSMALVVAFAGVARSSYDSIVGWMNETFNPDLFVAATQSFNIQTTRFPASMGPELAAIPGVRQVQLFRNGRITFRKTPITILAIEMAKVAETAPRQPIAGRAESMYQDAAAGRGVIVSDNLAQLQHLSLGEMVEIAAPYGVLRLPIVGVIVDYSDQQGAVMMDRSVFLNYWRDDAVRDFRLYLEPGASLTDVRERILAHFAGRYQVFVLANSEVKAYILKLTDQWFGLTSVQVVIAVLVAILGIFNTLTVSITDRRRELGVLRAVGALHGQVRHTIWIEALTVAAIGAVLGCLLGGINLFYLLQTVQQDIAGMRLEYQFPVSMILIVVPILLVSALASAIWPAESAVRGVLVEALEYE